MVPTGGSGGTRFLLVGHVSCRWVDPWTLSCALTSRNAELFPLRRYIPPLLWGKSGHLQTFLYGKVGRVNTPAPSGVRLFLPMPDGATATFDVFEALGSHSGGGERPASMLAGDETEFSRHRFGSSGRVCVNLKILALVFVKPFPAPT